MCGVSWHCWRCNMIQVQERPSYFGILRNGAARGVRSGIRCHGRAGLRWSGKRKIQIRNVGPTGVSLITGISSWRRPKTHVVRQRVGQGSVWTGSRWMILSEHSPLSLRGATSSWRAFSLNGIGCSVRLEAIRHAAIGQSSDRYACPARKIGPTGWRTSLKPPIPGYSPPCFSATQLLTRETSRDLEERNEKLLTTTAALISSSNGPTGRSLTLK